MRRIVFAGTHRVSHRDCYVGLAAAKRDSHAYTTVAAGVIAPDAGREPPQLLIDKAEDFVECAAFPEDRG
jgi:hypothetical protein